MLSINAFAPIIQQGINSFHERLQTSGEQCSFSVERGCDTASFVLNGDVTYLSDWYAKGLVRDMRWKAPDGGLFWRGFVSRLAYTVGGVTRTKSVEGLANRVVLVYDRINTGTNPPKSQGQQVITVNDTISQSKYGLKTVVISGEEATATNANVKALSELARLKEPQVGESQTVGQGDAPVLKVEMLGYGHMLDWYLYGQTASSGDDNASAIVGAVIAADPNNVISDSTLLIDTNTTQTERYWNNVPAWKVIETVTGRGRTVSGVGEPWVSQIYADLRLVFKAAEWIDSNGNSKSSNKHLRLYRQVYDPADIYTDEAGREIPYWQLRPDRLVYTAGLPGRLPLYVTKVVYQPPLGIQLSGLDLQQPWKGVVRV